MERPRAGEGFHGIGVGEFKAATGVIRGAERAAVHGPLVVHALPRRKWEVELLFVVDDGIAGHGQARAGSDVHGICQIDTRIVG